jgi:RNA polymerase sigma-70 factor (ECF subfamily)
MNRADYERAVGQHMDRVHSYAAWMLHDMEDARDVAQSVKSWLLKTAHRLAIDRLRHRKRRAEFSEEDLARLVDEHRPGPEQSVRRNEVGRMIGRALARLSDRDRSIVLMREVHGLSYEEIATSVDLPLGTVKAALHRARERLRRELAGAGVRP